MNCIRFEIPGTTDVRLDVYLFFVFHGNRGTTKGINESMFYCGSYFLLFIFIRSQFGLIKKGFKTRNEGTLKSSQSVKRHLHGYQNERRRGV